MNWMKVKIILIIFFLIINALLVSILVSRNYDGTFDSEGIAGDVYEILGKRDISVERDMIKTESVTSKTAYAYPVSSEESAFFGNLVANAEKTEDGKYLYNGSLIEVYDNFVHFDSLDGLYKNEKDYFESVGIDFDDSRLISEESNDADGIFVYYETYDRMEIFGTRATVKKTAGVVVSADIVWYEISEEDSKSAKTISFADALLDFAADKGRGNKPCAVVDITRGFSVDAGSESVSVSQMIPAIRLTTEIGSNFYYDARSPQ